MGYDLILGLNDPLLDGYRRAALANGRSLESELRAVLEAGVPQRTKDCAALLRLSDEALAMTPPDGPSGTDSTLLIRWDRDTGGGRWVDDGWSDDVGR